VLFIVAAAVFLSGILSIYRRGRLRPEERKDKSVGPARPAGLDAVAASVARGLEETERRRDRASHRATSAAPIAVPIAADVPAPGVPDTLPGAAAGAADLAQADQAQDDESAAEAADWPTGLS
jgi:hypothetical protein